jgi:hypothetical protein
MADCMLSCTGGGCTYTCADSADCTGACPTQDCTGNGFDR